MKLISLTQGRYAFVDEVDYARLLLYTWHVACIKGREYACTRPDPSKISLQMHRIIMHPSKELEIDHINGDGLDNRKENLRICTHQQNCANRRPNKNCLSQFRGVNWFAGKWVAKLRYNGNSYYIGRFLSEFDAAGAYDRKAKEFWGEFAYSNFPK